MINSSLELNNYILAKVPSTNISRDNAIDANFLDFVAGVNLLRF